jgi:RNA polymerase sigma-70 factor, ECF subfamily
MKFTGESESRRLRPLTPTMVSLQRPGIAPRDAEASGSQAMHAPDFEAVYSEHARFVWRSVRRMGIEWALVEDVVQDAFLVVHRRLNEFQGRSSVKTWLYGIVRRVVADHRRMRRRKPAHEAAASTPDLDALSDEVRRRPDACAEQAEQMRLLHRVLACLDEEKREVLFLSEFEGMTMAEISEALDVNANTVSSRLRSARREFEKALDQLTSPEAPPMERPIAGGSRASSSTQGGERGP